MRLSGNDSLDPQGLMATAESVSVRLFGETPSSGATAVGVRSWPVWKRLPDSLLRRATPNIGYHRLQAGEHVPEEDLHLSDQTHLPTHQGPPCGPEPSAPPRSRSA